MLIDSSQLQLYINCPFSYYNKFICKLAKIKTDDTNIHLDFGKSVHKALEYKYKGLPIEQAKQCFRDGFTCLPTEKIKTPANGEKLIEAYYNHYSKPINELSDDNFEILEVEKVNISKIGQVEYQVKSDLIVKHKTSGIFVMDHKTSQKDIWTTIKRLQLGLQISANCKVALEKYGQCSGFIINMMEIGYRERMYKGEPAGFHCRFQREIINRTKEQLDNFEKNVIVWSNKLKESILTDNFPQNFSQCVFCEYNDLCTSVDDENVKDTLYTVIDNPYKYLEE